MISSVGLVVVGGFLLAAAGVVQNIERKRLTSLFGNSRWASIKDIRKMGLEASRGVIVGDYKGKLLRCDIKSHIIVVAPSRSGKGVSQVIPNALSFDGSLLVTDLKYEIYDTTSGYRAKFCEVFLFAPIRGNHQTHCYNPLSVVDKDNPSKRVADIQLICQILITGKDGNDDYWIIEARSLCLGLLLYLVDSDEPFTFGALVDLLKGSSSLSATLENILETSGKLDSLARQNINAFLQKADKERSGVASTLIAALSLWDDPYVRAATNKSDFTFANMRKQRMAVYLGIPANEQIRLRPLMNLMVQQFAYVLSQELPKDDEPHHVLAILDEFCNLGKMATIEQGFSYMAGFHVHFMAIFQNISQGYKIYGASGFDSFLANTDYKIFYYQNETTGREFVAKLLGNKTVKNKAKSYSLFGKQSTSYSDNFIARPLLSADEVGQFDKAHAIALKSGHMPVKFKRIIYYKDKRFQDRLLPPITIASISPSFAKVKINAPKEINEGLIDAIDGLRGI